MHASKRHDQAFMGSIAIDEVHPLPGNLHAAVALNKPMKTGTAEHPLIFSAVFQQLELGAHSSGGSVRRDIFQRNICDNPAGA